MINLVNRINRATLEAPGAGVVDVTRYLQPGGFSRARAKLGTQIVRNGEITFETPAYDPTPVDLDKRTNSLWCRGAILKVYALDTKGNEFQLCELVLQKTSVRKINANRFVQAIACSFTDYLGEQNAKGKDVETIAPSGTSRRELVELALTTESLRSLSINLNEVEEDLLEGTFPLLANASNAQLAAQFAAPSLAWLYVDNSGTIQDAGLKLSNEGKQTPVERLSIKECLRYAFIPPSEDLATKVVAASNKVVRTPNPLPYTTVEESYAAYSDIFSNPELGSTIVLAVRVITRVNSRGEVTREITKPLASWVTFADGADPLSYPLLKNYYTVIHKDGLRVHDFDFRLIQQNFFESGIIGAFRSNFSATLEEAFADPQSFLERVELKSTLAIVHRNGLPLLRVGTEATLADNWINGAVTPDTATDNLSTIKWQEQWISWGRGLYRRRYHNSAPNLRSETELGDPTGPPSPDYLQVGDNFETELIQDEYETDVSNINCGQSKQITLQLPYASEVQLSRISQYELERRIGADRAIRIGVPMGDWYLKNYKPLSRVDVGKHSYRVMADSVAWDANRTLVVVLELHEIGELAAEILSPPAAPPAWPPSATPVFAPIVDTGACESPTAPPPFDGTLTINRLGDREYFEGQTITPILLGAVGGTAPYIFSDLGTLPPGLSVVGNFIEGTVTTAGTTTVTVQVTDNASDTDSTTFDIEVVAVETPVPPVPPSTPLRAGLAFGGSIEVLPYPAIPDAIEQQGGLAFGGSIEPEVLPFTDGGLALGGSIEPVVASPGTSEGGLAFAGEITPAVPEDSEGGLAFSGSIDPPLSENFEFNDGTNFEFNDGTNFEFNN